MFSIVRKQPVQDAMWRDLNGPNFPKRISWKGTWLVPHYSFLQVGRRQSVSRRSDLSGFNKHFASNESDYSKLNLTCTVQYNHASQPSLFFWYNKSWIHSLTSLIESTCCCFPDQQHFYSAHVCLFAPIISIRFWSSITVTFVQYDPRVVAAVIEENGLCAVRSLLRNISLSFIIGKNWTSIWCSGWRNSIPPRFVHC